MSTGTSVEALFFGALELESAAERAAFLDSACGADADKRRQVEALLHAMPGLGDLIPPVVEPAGVNPDPPDDPPPLERLGDFRIIREIGQGGMGVVYEAEQVTLGRHVALKILQRRLADSRMKRRFEREARAAAKLHHTNIVPVFGVGEHDGLPYFVMQLIPGLGLDQVLVELQRLQAAKSEGTDPLATPGGDQGASGGTVSAAAIARAVLTGHLTHAADVAGDGTAADIELGATSSSGVHFLGAPPTAASVLPGTGDESRRKQRTYWHTVARIGAQVAHALEYAHRQGVQHRDIKPSNLLLDSSGTVWVADFGLAKANDQENLTQVGDVMGTLRYMPPEAFDGQTDPRSDVYSLGLTLYELLALRPAFDGRGRPHLIKQVATEEPPRLDRLNPQVPRDLATIVHKAIESAPDRRYASAGELAADLQRFHDDEPIKARRQTWPERCLRWARQHKGLAASLATLALVLVTVAAGSSVAALQFRQVAEEKGRLAEQAVELAEEREEQRRRAEESQQDHQRLSSRLMVERGIVCCEREQFGGGLLWLARALEMLPPGDPALEQSCRTLLGGWGRRLAAQRVVLRCPAGVEAAAISPDGRTLLVGCADGTAWIWPIDPETLRPAPGGGVPPEVVTQPRPFPVGHRGAVLHVAFSPDGRTLATAGRDGTIELRNTEGKLIGQPPRHEGQVNRLVFSPDGKTLASGGGDGTARLWNVESASPACEPLRHKGAVRTLAFSPDGARLVTGSDDATAQVWQVSSGAPVGEALRHEGSVRAVAFSPDGKLVLTAGNDGSARLWLAATGQAQGAPVRHERPVAAVAFAPDGKRFVTACEDHNLYIWHTATLQAARGPLEHHDEVLAAAFSPDGGALLTGCADGTARLWDAASGRPLGDPMRSHGGLHVAAFSPDARWVLTGGHDRTVRLWEAAPATGPTRRLGPVGKAALAVAFSPDGKAVFVGGETGHFYDRGSGRVLGGVATPGELIGAAAYSPNGKTLATGGFSSAVRLWDVATGRQRGEPLAHQKPSWVLGVAFSPDGRTLLTGSGNYDYQHRRGEAQLWDLATGELRHTLRGHDREVTAVAYSPDGKTVATASRDRTVRLWDADTGRPRGQPLQHRNWVLAAAFTPDGRKVVTGSADQKVRVWDAATGAQMLAPLEHPKGVNAVAVSPDGRLILTGCEDGAARLWDAATGWPVDAPLWHEAPVLAVAFSPDGKEFLTGTRDGFAHLTAAPLPWTGSAPATVYWVRVNANQRLDPTGDTKPLEFTDWLREVGRLVGRDGN